VAKFLCRIVLLPLIVGVSYELIKFAAKRRGSFLATITAPGLWLQRITTQPPTDEMAAIAIRALEGAMALEKSQGGELVIAFWAVRGSPCFEAGRTEVPPTADLHGADPSRRMGGALVHHRSVFQSLSFDARRSRG